MAWVLLLAAGAALLTAQDPPRITLEKEGKLSEVVSELGRLVGPIGIDPKAEDKAISLSVREAGYFEVLDALCRSHGAADRSFVIADFDSGRGLTLLRGEARLTGAVAEEVQVALDPGREADVPGGKLVVEGLQEHKPNQWRITLTLKPDDPKATLRGTLDGSVLYEHSRKWRSLGLPSSGLSFEVDAGQTPARPGWMKLRFRTGERTVVLPFEFRNVRF